MGAMQIQRGFSSLFRLFEINSELMKLMQKRLADARQPFIRP
jgi:hypothetical protein